MKKIYIIPGYGETCFEPQYYKLKAVLEKKGYEVVDINPNWYKPLSEQTFRIEPHAILFGFSYGAILAYLIALKYPPKKLILASISPIHSFSRGSLIEEAMAHMSKEMAEDTVDDLKKIQINLSDVSCETITMAGSEEKMEYANVRVPKTGHKITPEYIEAIKKLV